MLEGSFRVPGVLLGLFALAPRFLLPGFGGIGALLQLVVLLGQALHVRPGGIQMLLCGVSAGLFRGKGIILGFQLVEQLLHPLAVPGGCGELFGTAGAGDQVQVLAGDGRQ